jgi:hypothetical protein
VNKTCGKEKVLTVALFKSACAVFDSSVDSQNIIDIFLSPLMYSTIF